MSSKKIDKEYCLTDDTTNCYGFRLLTAGYQQSEYAKNPIGYYMHERDNGVVLRWEDFRTEGDKVYAKPVINLSHERGQQTVDEIENGFLNGASVGHIVVLESSDDPADKVPGQWGPTVTKWFNRECSLVDIPGNFGGLCLYDSKGDEIVLSAFSPKKSTPANPDTSMSKIILLAGPVLAALNLGATATEQDAQTAIVDLAARNTTLVEDLNAMKTSLATATTEKATAEKALADLKSETATAKVKSLLDDASAAGKITQDLRADLEKDYASEPLKLENLLSKMTAYQPITTQLAAGQKEAGAHTVEAYDKAFQDGTLDNLKANNPEEYKALFRAKFNKDPK